MAFVSPPVPTTDPGQLVANDGWFPDIDLTLLRITVRVDPNVTDERLREAAVQAISSALDDLEDWKALQIEAGHPNLAAVPAVQIGGESRLVAIYRRAVHSYAAADLAARLRDIGTTSSGHDRADELVTTEDTHRQAARWAVRDILGKRRTTVELI